MADSLLLVHLATGQTEKEEEEEEGDGGPEAILECIYGQGLPTSLHVVQV